jgi:four helix bundle protein
MEDKKIRSFKDLDVYRNSYESAIIVLGQIIPKLPKEERYDLADQLRRSTKAIPRLIAEGYAKRHQNRGFQKYLDDALAESNETIVGLEQCKDIYGEFVNIVLCGSLIETYDKTSRQLYRLGLAWNNFYHTRSRNTKPIRHFETDADLPST